MSSDPFSNYDSWLTSLPEDVSTANEEDFTYFNSNAAKESISNLAKLADQNGRVNKYELIDALMRVIDCVDCDTYEKLRDQMY